MRYWIPTLAWLMVIYLFSSQPTVQTTSVDLVDFSIKKTAHFTEYFILTILMVYSLSKTTKLRFSRVLLLAVFLSVFYAVSDEWHQSFVPGRQPRVRDILIDTFGVFTACIAIKLRRFV